MPPFEVLALLYSCVHYAEIVLARDQYLYEGKCEKDLRSLTSLDAQWGGKVRRSTRGTSVR